MRLDSQVRAISQDVKREAGGLVWKLESFPKKRARKTVLKAKIMVWFSGITSFKNGAIPSLNRGTRGCSPVH
jgi:hypothetical protein